MLVRRTTVVSTERLSPHLIRVVVGGPDLDDFGAGEFTDHYVKLKLPPPDADYESDFDEEAIRATRAKELWPRTRTYTVRAWDPETRRLTIDFVVHGGTGVADAWASRAQVGDTLQLAGPGGAYAPDPDADWHLLVGDASVLPAVAATLPRIASGTPVFVVLEFDGPEDQQVLTTPGDLRLTWHHRADGSEAGSEALVRVVRELDLPPGRGQAFVHGEASAVRAVRRHLLVERGLAPHALSASGYWKQRRTEDGWREDKRDWQRLAAEDVAGV